MEKVRHLIKTSDNKTLLEMWATSRRDRTIGGMAVNVLLEAELEYRGVIAMNQVTMEYEVR